MITIIHGDDIVSSRNFFTQEKTKFPNHQTLTDSYAVSDIAQALERSLFGDETVIFIENLLTRKKSKEKEDIIAYIAKQKSNNTIYLWEDAEIPQKTIQLFTHVQSRLFKLPKLLFTFLDTLSPKNGNKLVILFHKVIEQADADFVFAMIARQFRLLLSCHPKLSEESSDTIDEVKRLAQWQISKLTKQRSFFTDAQLLSNYQKLLAIETSLKTGTLSLSLTQAIDFFLLDL